jgi:hypothetical protein
MAGIYHRRPVLDPALAKIGVGIANLADGTFVVALRFGATDGSGAWPVAYPADAQDGVPREYGNEIPNPVPGGGPAGYPITLQFPPFDKVTGVRAKLVDGKGAAVAFYLSDPEHPATSFPQSGIVSVIPKQALAPSTPYTITIDATWKGKRGSWRWSFTTLGLRAVDASDRQAMRDALGVPSLIRGTVSHAGTIAGATFLQLGRNEPMVSVIVPTAVWHQLGGAPAGYEGKTVEVDATPQLVDGKFLNLPIATAKQLRVVR